MEEPEELAAHDYLEEHVEAVRVLVGAVEVEDEGVYQGASELRRAERIAKKEGC